MKLYPYLTTHTKINSREINDLNIKCETMTIVEEIMEFFLSSQQGGNLFSLMQNRNITKEKVDKFKYKESSNNEKAIISRVKKNQTTN